MTQLNLQTNLHEALGKIKTEQSRNLVRGILSGDSDTAHSSRTINRLKKKLDGEHLSVASELLFGKQAKFPLHFTPQKFIALTRGNIIQDNGWRKEIEFLIPILNSWSKEVDLVVARAVAINEKIVTNPYDAFFEINELCDQWGISNFAIRKVAFIMSSGAIDKPTLNLFSNFIAKIGISDYPHPYVSLHESFNARIPYFENIQNWFSSFEKFQLSDFRQSLVLHNFVPVPLSANDVGAFLRRSHSMSFVDEIFAIKIVSSLKNELEFIAKTAMNELSAEIKASFLKLDVNPTLPFGAGEQTETDLDLLHYRKCLAFCELSRVADFRSYVDERIIYRVAPKKYKIDRPTRHVHQDWKELKRQLTHKTVGFKDTGKVSDPKNDGLLLRTVRFLSYLSEFPNHTDFDEHQIKFIFDHTTSLTILMSSEEIQKIFDSAKGSSKHIVCALAMALFRNKNFNEDADFAFRHHLQMAILQYFSGDIVEFTKWLGDQTPNVANYLTQMLDRSTLHKLYLLVGSASDANTIRQEILRYMGDKTNKIDYYVMADRLKVDELVQNLRHHIDDSRISIDEYGFKKWVNDYSIPKINEYARLIKLSLEKVILQRKQEPTKSTSPTVEIEIDTVATFEYIISSCISAAFHEFCLNSRFGVESYLGRRIRHNTLRGMMLGSVESVIQKQRFNVLRYEGEFWYAYELWLERYKVIVEQMRSQLLQFRSKEKPIGLFQPELDLTSAVYKSSIAKLRDLSALDDSFEQFIEEILLLCWKFFALQLADVSRYIRIDLLNQVLADIDQTFHEDTLTVNAFRAELKEVVREKFEKLSSWFRVPETGAISASLREIAELVKAEWMDENPDGMRQLDLKGTATEQFIYGLSVHHVYDCLFVLIRNAFAHADEKHPVTIEFKLVYIENLAFPRLQINCSSKFRSEEIARTQFKTLTDKITSDEDLEKAMVIEGYSGIRKILHILSTLRWSKGIQAEKTGLILKLSFELPVELSGNKYAGDAS